MNRKLYELFMKRQEKNHPSIKLAQTSTELEKALHEWNVEYP